MKLLPSLKQKKRYILFQIVSDTQFSTQEIKTTVKEALKDFLGELGLAKSAPLFVKEKDNKFILKVNHKYINESISALILIKRIKNKPVIVKSIITSGTIKKATSAL